MSHSPTGGSTADNFYYALCESFAVASWSVGHSPRIKHNLTTVPTGAVIEYRLDLGAWSTDAVISGVPYGKHTVSLRYTNGTQICYATRKLDETAFDACGKLACDDLYITATDSQGLETYTIPRDPATKGVKSLVLKVASFSGDPLNGLTYQWSLSPNAPAFTSTQASISIAMPGTYKVTLARGTSTCSTLITIGASPCNTIADPATRTCTTSALTGIADEAANRLTDLAAGDVVQAGDFNITITEVTGTSSGWNGKGYVTVPYLNAQVNIVLQNAVFNDCYQLTNANSSSEQPTVFTAYDPNWGNVSDIDNLLANFKSSLQEMIEVMNNFSGKCDDVRALDKAVREYEQAFSQPNNIYNEAERTEMLAKINELKAKRDQLVSCADCTISGARIVASSDASSDCGAKALQCRDALKSMLEKVKADDPGEKCDETKRLNTIFAVTKNPAKFKKYPNFYNGAAVAVVINKYYQDNANKAHKITFEYGIPQSSAKGQKGYADILNLTTGEIFEIKSSANETSGKNQLDIYIAKATSKCGVPPNWKAGNSVFPVGKPNAVIQNIVLDGKKKVLTFWMSEKYDGVVLYQLDDVKDETPWHDVFNYPEAMDALKLLLGASMTKIKQVTKPSDIPALKEELLTKFTYVMKRLPTSTVRNLAILAGGTLVVTIIAHAIPGFQYGAAVATVCVGVIGIVAYDELNHRPQS